MAGRKSRGVNHVRKAFANRKLGLLKKSYELSQLTQAHVALLIESNGKTYLFKSDEWFAPYISDIPQTLEIKPEHLADIIREHKAAVQRREERKDRRGNGENETNEETEESKGYEGCEGNEGIAEHKETRGKEESSREEFEMELRGEVSSTWLSVSTKPLQGGPLGSTQDDAVDPSYYPLAADFF